jgi:ornithine cyclodeaminase
MTGLQVLSEEEVAAKLGTVDVLEVVRNAFLAHHRGEAILPEEAALRWQGDDGGPARSIAMHAYLPGPPPCAGIKVINAAVRNPERGLPRASGTITLFDPLTARISMLLPAAEISAMRTAAVSTLAALHLANRHSVRLGILGAGVLAAAHVRMLTAELPITETLVFDPVADRAQAFARWAPGGHVMASARESVEGADVVVAATTVTEPYVESSWLTPGALVLNVSLDDLTEAALLSADHLYVDDWEMVVADTQRLLGRLARAGRVTGPNEAPPLGGRSTTGTLGALFAGDVPGRKGDGEVIIVNPFGLAISDIALAAAVVDAPAPPVEQEELLNPLSEIQALSPADC